MIVGSLAVYCSLFAAGYWLYGRHGLALALTGLFAVCTAIVFRIWRHVSHLLRQEEKNHDGSETESP
jgi:hypothetical protein